MSHKSKRGKNHPTANPKENSAQKESTNRHVYVEPGVQIDVVQNLKDQHQTERAEDNASHKKQLFWTKVATVLVFLTASIYLLQWCTQVNALKVDQRAWISVKEVKLITPYSATSEGKIGIRIINSGKTPALRTDLTTASFGQTSDAKLHLVTPSVAMAVGPGIGDATLVLDVPPSDPTAKVYLHFVIQYWDIFQKPSDRPHYTLFCGYYSPPAQTPLFFSTADSVGCNAMN